MAWILPGSALNQHYFRTSLEDAGAVLSRDLMARYPRVEWAGFGSVRRCLEMGFRHLDYGLLERVVDQFMDAVEEMLDAELDGDETG